MISLHRSFEEGRKAYRQRIPADQIPSIYSGPHWVAGWYAEQRDNTSRKYIPQYPFEQDGTIIRDNKGRTVVTLGDDWADDMGKIIVEALNREW